MDIKKLIIGGVTGGILLFLLGWLIYGNLLVDYMKTHSGTVPGVDRTEMLFMYLVVGNLLSGLLLAYIFIKAKVNSLSDGLVTAGIVGLLMTASFDAVMYATTNITSKKMILADVIAFTIMMAITGAIVGFVMNKLNKPA
jgi:hypothetical protein